MKNINSRSPIKLRNNPTSLKKINILPQSNHNEEFLLPSLSQQTNSQNYTLSNSKKSLVNISDLQISLDLKRKQLPSQKQKAIRQSIDSSQFIKQRKQRQNTQIFKSAEISHQKTEEQLDNYYIQTTPCYDSFLFLPQNKQKHNTKKELCKLQSQEIQLKKKLRKQNYDPLYRINFNKYMDITEFPNPFAKRKKKKTKCVESFDLSNLNNISTQSNDQMKSQSPQDHKNQISKIFQHFIKKNWKMYLPSINRQNLRRFKIINKIKDNTQTQKNEEGNK